jgi:hypothetical protein
MLKKDLKQPGESQIQILREKISRRWVGQRLEEELSGAGADIAMSGTEPLNSPSGTIVVRMIATKLILLVFGLSQ